MASENLLKSERGSEISKNASGIFSEAGLSEEEKALAVESFKAKLMKMKDSLKKMDEIIEDLKKRLHNNDGGLDEYMGV
jgi:flagellin-specific chaperone FliS